MSLSAVKTRKERARPGGGWRRDNHDGPPCCTGRGESLIGTASLTRCKRMATANESLRAMTGFYAAPFSKARQQAGYPAWGMARHPTRRTSQPAYRHDHGPAAPPDGRDRGARHAMPCHAGILRRDLTHGLIWYRLALLVWLRAARMPRQRCTRRPISTERFSGGRRTGRPLRAFLSGERQENKGRRAGKYHAGNAI